MSAELQKVGRRLGAILTSTADPGRGRRGPQPVALYAPDQSLMALPWELAASPDGDPARFLFAPGAAVLTRCENGLSAPGRQSLPGPLTVTLIVEKAAHHGLSDLTGSVAAIQATLERGMSGRGRAGSYLSIGTLRAPPPAGRPTRVLHLLGHGYETAGVDARFEYGMHCASLQDVLPHDCYGEAPAERIAEELARHAPVDVLLLDACYTGGGLRWDGVRWRDPLCTYASRLGCSVVVSFFDAIRSSQASAFCLRFYERVFAGDRPLAAAVAARKALFLAEAGSPLHECAWWKVRIATGLSAEAHRTASAAHSIRTDSGRPFLGF